MKAKICGMTTAAMVAMVATMSSFVVPVAVTHLQKPVNLIRIVEELHCTTL